MNRCLLKAIIYVLVVFILDDIAAKETILLRIDSDHTKQFRPAKDTLSDKVLDGNENIYFLSNSKNRNPSWTYDCNKGDLTVNKYPVLLDYQNDITVRKFRISGYVSQTSERKPLYCNSSALTFFHSNNIIVENIRIDSVWDGIRIARDSNDFVIKDVWVSNVRDDCIENDQMKSGIVTDSLFDGCFVGLSVSPGKSEKELSAEGKKVIIEKTLIRMASYLHRKSSYDNLLYSHGHIFKSSINVPMFEIHNSIFALQDKPFHSDSRWLNVINNLSSCSSNLFLWMSDKKLPEVFKNTPSCFDVIVGQRAIQKWNELRKNWIDCHPEVVRFEGDDLSDISMCK